MHYVIVGMQNEMLEDGEKVMMDSVTVHPQRDPATFSNDLAIIKLAADVTFSERVKPICIGDLSHKITAGDQVHQLRHIYFLDPTGYQKSLMLFVSLKCCPKHSNIIHTHL